MNPDQRPGSQFPRLPAASIIKRKKSRYWIACFTDRDGRQSKRSTKTNDRNQAMEIALELERVERQARQGVLTTTQGVEAQEYPGNRQAIQE